MGKNKENVFEGAYDYFKKLSVIISIVFFIFGLISFLLVRDKCGMTLIDVSMLMIVWGYMAFATYFVLLKVSILLMRYEYKRRKKS